MLKRRYYMCGDEGEAPSDREEYVTVEIDAGSSLPLCIRNPAELWLTRTQTQNLYELLRAELGHASQPGDVPLWEDV